MAGESRRSASASRAVLRIGFPRALKDVLMRTAQPVRAFTASNNLWSQASSVGATVCGRAVPSKWTMSGSAAAAAAVSLGAKLMYGDRGSVVKTRSASSTATTGAQGRHHSRNLTTFIAWRAPTTGTASRLRRPSARGPNSVRDRATPMIAPPASASATASSCK